jgi:hypothetical protein
VVQESDLAINSTVTPAPNCTSLQRSGIVIYTYDGTSTTGLLPSFFLYDSLIGTCVEPVFLFTLFAERLVCAHRAPYHGACAVCVCVWASSFRTSAFALYQDYWSSYGTEIESDRCRAFCPGDTSGNRTWTPPLFYFLLRRGRGPLIPFHSSEGHRLVLLLDFIALVRPSAGWHGIPHVLLSSRPNRDRVPRLCVLHLFSFFSLSLSFL